MRKVLAEPDSEPFCVQFDPEDRYLGVGYSDGTTRLYNLLSGKMSSIMVASYSYDKKPITSIR